jgi:membrane associated rhomboid family serine protease
MNDVSLHPLEAILRLCAAAAPGPWYPRVYARDTGVDLDRLGDCLEDLWLDGLIERAGGGQETGPGFVLTDAARRVLEDPEELQRLRDGLPLATQDRGAVVRQALRRPPRPVLTRLLLAANLLVFGYGLYRAYRLHAAQEFLRGLGVQGPRVLNILHDTGALTGADVIHGEWWRLLTMAFVHIGPLHLLMNMYMLWAAGSFVEAMWGRARYLVIYALGALGGSCLAVAHTPQASLIAGASGALCGLLAAEAVWVLLNARYLPRALARRGRASILTTFLLLVFISWFPGVSGWGHFGGAAAGGAAALLLHFQRFGPSPWRWLAVAALVPLPWLGFRAIERERAGAHQAWYTCEEQEFVLHYEGLVRVTIKSEGNYQESVEPVLEMRSTRRPAQAVEKLLPELAEQARTQEVLAGRLARAGPYYSATVEEARQAAQEYIAASARMFELAERCLRSGDAWTNKDEKELQEQTKQVEELRSVWGQRSREVWRSLREHLPEGQLKELNKQLEERQRELPQHLK